MTGAATDRFSLGARLSLWLALQSMAGLGLVCGALYLAMNWTLRERQHDTLMQKEQAVREQVAMESSGHQSEQLSHLLEAVLAGHTDIGLSLVDGQGRTVFDQPLQGAVSSTGAHHVVTLSIPSLPGPVRMTLELDTSADTELLQRMSWMLLLAAVLGTAMATAGGFVLVRWNLKPLHHLVAQTRLLEADTLQRRLDGSAQPAEMQPLIAQFNALLGRLSAAYMQMEAFNADVAHELNTPLTILISSSELALRKARSLPELQEVLGSNLEELGRLARIVADMLFLSRAHRGIGARRAPVDSLATLAADVAEFHEAALEDAELSLRIEGDAAVQADGRLLQRALSNLLGNAVRYATPGSAVNVQIVADGAGRVEIAVENQGDTVAPEHLPRLFDRFFRVDPARSHADRNHGLGLSIVAAIAHMHQGGTLAHSVAGRTRIGLWIADGVTMTKPSPDRLQS
ncbi:MAG: two-component sensor histidine kinase [Variovorax paradoxus]|nr:MAG: two-component sensor histidine kinase [Variovorax paradoxus]PZQ01175.1 MAG: two-component sensor histidine kinase [Variovorax paradoxus]